MSLRLGLLAIMIIAGAAGWASYARARRLRTATRLHSLPIYHGTYAALWAAIPAILETTESWMVVLPRSVCSGLPLLCRDPCSLMLLLSSLSLIFVVLSEAS